MNIQFWGSNKNNYKSGRTDDIQYIVIHYTANKGDTAYNNALYFSRTITKTSAHYFCDESEIWQSVRDYDTAYHCGGGKQSNNGGEFYGICTNSNSIGIEICMNDRNGNIREKSIETASELIVFLANKYNVKTDHIIRHYDVSGKNCPAPMVKNKKLYDDLIDYVGGDIVKRYNSIDDCPEWAKDTIKKLIKKGYLTGDGESLNLSEDMIRMLVINDRAGVY